MASRNLRGPPTRARPFVGVSSMVTKIKKGLNLPISGAPRQEIVAARPVRTVALIGDDYQDMKPTMLVAAGDDVKLGQPVFEDKRNPGVQYTAPGCGKILAVHRGAKRKFESLVIELDGDEEVSFSEYTGKDLAARTDQDVQAALLTSGLWTALRTRPFGKVPAPDSRPNSLFVTAMDTRPLAADPAPIIAASRDDFVVGLKALSKLTPKTFLCHAAGSEVPGADVDGVHAEQFAGPHPAGLPGTHIHHLDPVSSNRTVWYVGAQDVIAIGRLFLTGRLSVERVVSLAGPSVRDPRLLRTRLGASTEDLTGGEIAEGDHRVVSGSVLGGRTSTGVTAFLGRYHEQISVLREGRDRELLGWQMPGFQKFSIRRVFAAAWTGKKQFAMTTDTGGSKRAMVPIGMYEDVMPLDIVPTYLLRSLIVNDTEQATALGALELEEEDLALCTFVCPGKYEYGPILRRNLETIDKEG